MTKRQGAVALSLALLFGIFSGIACAPPQQIFMKEKVIERNAIPQPAIINNFFKYQTPLGGVDIVLIVDNTETFESNISRLHTSYKNLLQLFGTTPEASELSFHAVVSSTPKNRAPKDFATNGKIAAHLSQLFDGEGAPTENPIFTQANDKDYRETGNLTPLFSAHGAVGSSAFKEREFTPLYLIFALGYDLVDDSEKTPLNNLRSRLAEKRGLHQVHSVAITNKSRCGLGYLAERFLTLLTQLPVRSSTQFDLCDPNWESWETKLFQSILDFKSKMVLSRVPYQPESMTLRSATRLYRYGQEYVFDAATNEIRFVVDPELKKGDNLHLAYRLTPDDAVFNGVPSPNPYPSSRP